MSVITAEDCQRVLNNYCGKPAKFSKFEVSKLSDKTVGFLGDHFWLTINFEDDKNQSTELKLFLKCLPQVNQTQKKYVDEMQVFKKETLIYKQILPELQQLSNVKFAPNCYLVKEDCIVLENLAEAGFAVVRNTFDLSHCKAVLKSIAALHSASIIYEEQKSKELGKTFRFNEHFEEALQEGTFSVLEGHPRQKWSDSSTTAIANCIKLMPQFKNANEIIEKLWKLVNIHVNKFIKPSKIYRNVIVHDDLWSNNILFNKKSSNDISCVLVDFQLTRYVPPALDVLLVLYLNVEGTFLQQNFDSLLNIYYNFLEKNINRHNIDLEEIISKESFVKSVQDYRLSALLEATMYGTNVFINQELSDIITSNEKVFAEFTFNNRSKHICDLLEKDANFKKRFTDVLIPLVDCLQQ